MNDTVTDLWLHYKCSRREAQILVNNALKDGIINKSMLSWNAAELVAQANNIEKEDYK